ncbi:MAG: hypothetical protein ACLPNY_11950 [Roseiarcus sp.]
MRVLSGRTESKNTAPLSADRPLQADRGGSLSRRQASNFIEHESVPPTKQKIDERPIFRDPVFQEVFENETRKITFPNFFTPNSLKFHKTAKKIFGKVWKILGGWSELS